MTPERLTITIECEVADARDLNAALAQAIKAERAATAPDDDDNDAAPRVSVSQRTVRGADAVTLAQFVINVTVNVDIGQILYGVAAILAASQARVVFPGKSKKIENKDDVAVLLEDHRQSLATDEPPTDTTR